jgi:hypothetical protein
MKTTNKYFVLLAIVVLVFAALACGSSSNTGSKVAETGGESSTQAPPKVEVYKIGDVIQVGNHTIVLNSAEVKGNILHANFTVENKGSEDLGVSSVLNFSAKDAEGTKLEQNIFDCGSSGLDGKVLPGDKLRGDICWSGATKMPIKIYYEANLFGSGAIVWEISQ